MPRRRQCRRARGRTFLIAQRRFGQSEFCTAGSAFPAALKSLPQYGQNLSVSTTSCLHCGQDGCRLHLQLGQKLKRAPTVVEQRGQGYGSGSRTRKKINTPRKGKGQESSRAMKGTRPVFYPRPLTSRFT